MIPEFIDQRFIPAAIAALLAGLVRGFSGFGPAMVFTPVAAAIYGPTIAVPVLFIIDSVISVPVVVRSVGKCHWREVLPIAAGAAVTIPLGVWMLVLTEPTLLRWILCAAILLAVAALASGWRYSKAPSLPATVGIGGLSGFGGGFAGLYGPPIILFWLGGQSAAATVRANIYLFFGLTAVVGAGSLWYAGLFTDQVLWFALIVGPLYAAGLWTGSHLFGRTNESVYRRITLTMCAIAALVGLPLWG